MNYLKYFFVLFVNFAYIQKCQLQDPQKFIVWGPGLKADFTLPVRFIFIQTVDKYNQNLTNSLQKNSLKIEILNIDNELHARVHIQILDRNDGTYIIRYRLFDSYRNGLRILVTFKNKHVAGSPYILKGFVKDEKCNCPDENFHDWYERMGCNQTYTQIERDLSRVSPLNMNKLYDLVVNKFNQRYSQSLCHYAIIKNKIYRKCFGEHVGFHMFSDAILLSLTRKIKLPDLEFFMNLGDWPLVPNRDEFLPIISWCGSTDFQDIILPTYELTESTLEMMGRQSLDIFSVQGNIDLKWPQKENKAFWRGRDSRQERLDLIMLSKKHPQLLDAALTNMFFYREQEHLDKYGPIVNRSSFYDFFKYKYQINIDGTVAAYRLPYLLVSDSVVLKQDSVYYEHFYNDLKPNIHFVPFKHDLSDFIEKLKWVMSNDKRAQKIVQNAQAYTREYLQPHHIYCYHAKLFWEYSKKLTSKAKKRNNMDYVKQDKNSNSCRCNLKVDNDEL